MVRLGAFAMKKSLLLSFAAVVLLLGACLSVASAAGSRSSTPRENWAVIQIGENYEVIQTSQLNDKKKELKKKYDEELKKYNDRRKLDPSVERPQKETLTVIQKGFSTQEVAKELCDKLIKEKEDKEKEAEKDKEKGKGTGKKMHGGH
jgi:hypothetical protein